MWRGLDTYVVQARVIPSVATVLPPIVLLATGIITGARLGIAAGVVGAVLAAIAAQLGRDRGRRLQSGLWSEWGGAPTLQRLRYAGQSNPERVRRLHERIEAILGDHLPTEEEEAADTSQSDDRYEEAAGRIRARTGDHTRFALLFSENISYGMRRNLLGLKPLGVGVAIITLVASGLLLWLTHGTFGTRVSRFVPGGAAGLLMLAFWSLVVSRDWVRTPADAYADQFVAAIEQLHSTLGF
jgi:hypothetical protein